MQSLMGENKLKIYNRKVNPCTLLENGQKCFKLPRSLQNAPWEELKLPIQSDFHIHGFHIHRFNQPWIKNIQEKKFQEVPKSKT